MLSPTRQWPMSWLILQTTATEVWSSTHRPVPASRHSRGALLAGAPARHDPFSAAEIDRWTGLTWDPMQSAVAVLLRHTPGLPVHRLPLSWRLPHSAAPVISEAFYPFTGFRAGTAAGQRRLEVATSALGADPAAGALDVTARSGWALSA